MSLVSVHNEWDPLEEMIIGVADGARVPSPDRGLYALDYADRPSAGDIPTGPYDDRVINEAAEDLDAFAKIMEDAGVVVRRPTVTDHTASFGPPDWRADGEYNFCPRDVLLPIGQMIIETPMVLRTRYFEQLAYKEVLLDYFRSGAGWISAPKPALPDATYRTDLADGEPALAELEPVFDAANVIRIGRDILYQVSRSGNHLGYEWLRRLLGDEYRVHPLEGVYDGAHLDTTVAVLRPGLVLLNPERIRPDQVPAVFRGWDVIWCPEMVDAGGTGGHPRSSAWQGMNVLMISPDIAVLHEEQLPLIRELERHHIEVMALPMRQARALGGGVHGVSLDVRRTGGLEDYS